MSQSPSSSSSDISEDDKLLRSALHTKLNFGKYKGQLLMEVAEHDFQYLNWLVNDYDFVKDKCHKLAKKIRMVINHLE